MTEHFRKIKPSLSDLPFDQQLEIHERVRASRKVYKHNPSRQTKTTPEQKRNKKMSDLIKGMSPEELDKLENMIGDD